MVKNVCYCVVLSYLGCVLFACDSDSDSSTDSDAALTADAALRDALVTNDAGEVLGCTLIIGFSQAGRSFDGWFVLSDFENIVDGRQWELRWMSGAGVDKWKADDYSGWDAKMVSPCVNNPENPDRVILSISGPHGDDEVKWEADIKTTIGHIRSKYPSAKKIMLLPVVGGPGEGDCDFEGERVRAAWQYKHIAAVVAKVVAEDSMLSAGYTPEVDSCSDYADVIGHFTPEGARAAGNKIAQFFKNKDNPQM